MFIIFSLPFFCVFSPLTSAAFPGGQGGGSLRDGEYKLAQSGDATCNGLDSAEVRLINYSLLLLLQKLGRNANKIIMWSNWH